MPYRNYQDKLAYMKRYRAANLERERQRTRKWYSENREYATAQNAAYAKDHPGMNKDAVRKYRAARLAADPNFKNELAAKARRNRKSNPAAYRAANIRCYRKRRENPAFVIECRLRARLNKILRRTKAPKFDSTFALVGCSAEFLRGYLQAMFKPGMQWNNVHIDHIKPISSFDLSDSEQQRVCFHYSNLQPLSAIENMSKGATVSHE